MNRIVSLLDKVAAVLRRDLLIAIRYRGALFVGFAGAALEIAGLYYLSRAIGPGFRPDGMDSYPFLLVGTGLYTFLLMGISSFLSTVQEAQQAGTLEVLMTTPTSAPTLLLLGATSSFAARGLAFLVYLCGGFIISGIRLGQANIVAAFCVVFLSIALAVAIGIGAAGIQVAIQKGSGVVWLLGSGAWLLTGAMFPVSALPRWLQTVAALIPMTHALSAMRLALFGGASTMGLYRELITLTAFTLLLLPCSLLFFAGAVRRARLSGSLSYY